MVRIARSLPDLAFMINRRCDQITEYIRYELGLEAENLRRDLIKAVKEDDLALRPLKEKTLENRRNLGIMGTAPLYATGNMMNSFMTYRFGNRYGAYYRVAASNATHITATTVKRQDPITNASLFHKHAESGRNAMQQFIYRRNTDAKLRRIVEKAVEGKEYPEAPRNIDGSVSYYQGGYQTRY